MDTEVRELARFIYQYAPFADVFLDIWKGKVAEWREVMQPADSENLHMTAEVEDEFQRLCQEAGIPVSKGLEEFLRARGGDKPSAREAVPFPARR